MQQDSVFDHMGPPPYIALAAIGLLVSASIAQSEADGSRNDTGTDQIEVGAHTVVVIGASYVAGGNPERPIAGYQIIHKGVSGEQSFEMLARFQRDVIALKPEAVMVWGFNNDVIRSDRARIDHTLRRTRESMLAMIQLANTA